MVVYCKCGFKSEYSGVKPKFCAACGKAYDAPVVKAAAKSSAHQSRHFQEAHEPEFLIDNVSDLGDFFKASGSEERPMTIGEVQRNKDISYSRQIGSMDADVSSVKNKVIQDMLNGGTSQSAFSPPQAKPNIDSRRRGKKWTPPAV